METIDYEEFITRCKNQNEDILKVVFVCPKCETPQTGNDLIEVGAGNNLEDIEGYLGYSCLGRFDDSKGCNWSLGGLFKIHELEINIDEKTKREIFRFASNEEVKDYYG